MNKHKAFTTTEVLLTLGIVGILAVTMLTLNSQSDFEYNTASTKLAKADTALRSWGKAVSKMNETGFGIFKNIDNDEEFSAALYSAMNTDNTKIKISEDEIEEIIPIIKSGLAENEKLNDSHSFTLENGVTVTTKYLNNICTTAQEAGSPCAIVSLAIEAKQNGTKYELSEQYAVFADDITNAGEIYKGFESYTITQNCGDKMEICYIPTACASDPTSCPSDYPKAVPSEICTDIKKCPSVFYEKPGITTYPCADSSQTGHIEVKTFATLENGTNANETNKCCAAPKTFNEKAGKCTCPSDFVPKAGYIKANNDACQVACAPGTFAASTTECKLCLPDGTSAEDAKDVKLTKGHYCPTSELTAPIICPKGSYCPNDKNIKDKDTNKYHADKFADEKAIKDGGLINSIKCPAGFYCNEEGLFAAKPCPSGAYCPANNASNAPIACPAGTYNPLPQQTSKTACKPCAPNTYSDTPGASACISCDLGTQSKQGATYCTGCPAGSYFSTTKKGCVLCPAGTYQDKGNQLSCKACPGGTFQNKQGATRCMSCPFGTAAPEPKSDAKIGATACTSCKAGEFAISTDTEPQQTRCLNEKNEETDCYVGVNLGATECRACPAGTYQSKTKGNTCIWCPCGQYTDKEGQTACKNMDAGTYSGNTGNTTSNGTICNAQCIAGIENDEKTGACLGTPEEQEKRTIVSSKTLCPAGSCQALTPQCPAYASIYVVTDGHGHTTTLNTLLNTFTCIDRDFIIKDEFYNEWINKTFSGYRIFIFAKIIDFTDDGSQSISFKLIDTKIWAHNTYALEDMGVGNSAYIDTDKQYKLLNTEDTGHLATCGGHSSTLAGGTIQITDSKTGVACNYYLSLYGKVYSPLVLDLENDNDLSTAFTNIENGVMFDLAYTGKPQQTAWTKVQYKFDNAFLCLDRNKNGLIDDGSELFGDQNGAANGFEELQKYDFNENGDKKPDGIIDEKDKVYNDLLLWVDFNKNGIVDYIAEADYNQLLEETDNGADLSKNLRCENKQCDY